MYFLVLDNGHITEKLVMRQYNLSNFKDVFHVWPQLSYFRSSHPEVFCKKDVLKNFTTFTGKHLVFSSEFCEIFKSTFFIEHLWWLRLLILGGRHYHILKDISKECLKILDDSSRTMSLTSRLLSS